MRILLLHPDDPPLEGPWVGQAWDVAFDLGRSSGHAYERWSRVLGCPVQPMDGVRDGHAEIHKVRELLQLGLGCLVDREGLDWWELTAILVHFQLETLVVLRKLANQLPADAEVWITRSGFEAAALELLLGARLRVISSRAAPSHRGVRHYLGRLRQLPVWQTVQILGDKYDAGYKLRRHFHQRPRRNLKSVVLAPSSYVNMSLTAIAYSRQAPDRSFLLVSTRSSGRLNEVPENVSQGWLASYAGDSSNDENREILKRWEGLKKQIQSVPELGTLLRLGMMDDFPRRFADGLLIRNAWLRVLNLEPIEAVLCSDDTNPYTHIPLLLGRARGLPAIACHHGALDGRYLIKTCHADVILAKGRMELDYLVNTCGMDSSLIEIGAPLAPEYEVNARTQEGDWIVFFSEPYEVMTERAEEIYRDIIPGLADLAYRTGKTLVVKLHPSENLAHRQSLVAQVLTRDQSEAMQWLTGRIGPELLRRMWFGVTVQSSVAVECAVQGIPCFLCEWLDLWPYGYLGQFQKFDVAMGLASPSDIPNIPDMLAEYRPSRTTAESCCEAITPERFKEILAGRRVAAAPLVMQRAK